jgi:hypothetical protein
MLKCTLTDGRTRYFNIDVVHSINEAPDGEGLIVLFRRADGDGIANVRISEFQLIKSGTKYK